jgi:hypothetical protein
VCFWIRWVYFKCFFFWILNENETADFVSEVFAGHAGVLFGFFTGVNFILSDYSGINGNSNSGIDVVTSTHNSSNTSSFGLLNRCYNLLSEWILETKDSVGGQIILEHFSVFFSFKIVIVQFNLIKFPHRHISISHQNCSISLSSEFLDSPFI